MKTKKAKRIAGLAGVGALALSLAAAPWAARAQAASSPIKHVLLLSIDGMHAIDFANCSKGISGVNGGAPYCPNMAALAATGLNYLGASTSMPSDSFPGLMALVTGGSPRSTGAYYDVAYDRYLAPPAKTTGNGLAAGTCTPGVANGTTTEYEEGVDIDQTKLNGGAPSGDGGINSIDAARLIRDPGQDCAPVYPWNFIRTNTIFGVVHAAGGYTAWSDKHPAYSSVSGNGDGTNVDDYYSPEINSIPVPVPVHILGLNCSPNLPDPAAATSSNTWVDSFANIQCYDGLKVAAMIHEIHGKTHNGLSSAPVPALFGMNFQAVSIGEKLIQTTANGVLTGGYVDSIGTPTAELLSEIEFADASIGAMVKALKDEGLFDSTLIVITAKHGQSPIDPNRFLRIPADSPSGTTPADILASLLPFSESPTNPTGIGPTQDDVSLIWLADSSNTAEAVGMLESTSPVTNNIAGIGEIYSGPGIGLIFGVPGLSPDGDPRVPDILVTPNIGVIYTGSHKKLMEHGGFAHDDTNVMMLLSNPDFTARTLTGPVRTAQVAPTIVKELGLNPRDLKAVRLEQTPVLPGL